MDQFEMIVMFWNQLIHEHNVIKLGVQVTEMGVKLQLFTRRAESAITSSA